MKSVSVLRFVAGLTCLACLTWLSSVAPAFATSDSVPSVLSDYRVTSWVGGDGVTLGEVRSITQDAEGYLYLASDAGLVRFDGFRFTTTDITTGPTPLPTAPARAVYIARDGSLWVGYGRGHGLYHLRHGEVSSVQLRGEARGFINVVTEDRAGALWVGHDDGVQRLRAGRWEQVPLPVGAIRPGDTGGRVYDILEDRAGTIWIATLSGLFRQGADGAFVRAPQSDGPARSIVEDADGRLWTTDEAGGLRRADAPDRNRLFDARGMSLLFDRSGALWVTTIGQGLWQVRHDGRDAAPLVRRVTVQTGLASDENSKMFEDRDGNIWVSSLQGLNRLTPHKVQSLVDIGMVRALAVDRDGTALAGTSRGLVAISGVTSHSQGTSHVVSSAPVRAMHRAPDGTLWSATDAGLQHLTASGLEAVPLIGPRLSHVTSIDSGSHGTLWVCDEAAGLFRISGGRVEPVPSVTADTSAQARFAHVDGSDRVWVALNDGTVRVLATDGTVTRYGRAEGLAHATVYSIQHDRSGNIWIGGDNGLSLLMGNRFETLSSRHGLPERPVIGMVEDDAADLWLAFSVFGFVRLSRIEIDLAIHDPTHRLRYRVYNTADGAGYPDGSYRGNGVRSPKGPLWFVTSRGLTIIDPLELRRTTGGALNPPRIVGISVDDQRRGPTAGLVLPPRTARLRIDYTVVSLSSSLNRVRFRYRLEGFDKDWVDGSGARQALYTNLGPGSYRFRLQASSTATTWNDTEADWSFSIEPMFYQTRWFWSICVLGLALCAIGAWRLRVGQLRKEVSAVFGERIRLSRDIHDTLLQSLYGIALQLDAVSHGLDGTSPTRHYLQRIRRQIEGYIREARQTIWDLRSPVLDQHGLVGALRETGDRLTEGKMRMVFTVTGNPRPCPSKLETQVLRICHEAIMNAVRHAEARQVYVELGFDDRWLRLRVADDGRGFRVEDTAFGDNDQHYGLLSMKERAAEAGGRCTIESAPGSGVEVIAEFPLAPAA